MRVFQRDLISGKRKAKIICCDSKLKILYGAPESLFCRQVVKEIF